LGPCGTQRSGRALEVVLGVGLLLLGQHGHVLGDASRPRLGPLGVLDLVQDGVPVPAVKFREELTSLFVLLQLPAQVVWHRGGARCVVGGIPSAVGLGTLYFPETRSLHLAALYKILGLLAVDLRPLALGSTRREPLQVVVLVELARLAIDPAVAEGDFDGLIVGDALDARALLGDLEPQPLGRCVPSFEPGLPRGARGERDDRQVRSGGDGVSFRRSVPLCGETVEGP
jgi:hypothetical protein